MNISVLCTDRLHPIIPELLKWGKQITELGHQVSIVHDQSEATGGDFLFLVSCSQILNQKIIENYAHTLVLHASDLPNGRGWSPYVWSILSGEKQITVTLLEAEKKVDSGRIWLKGRFELEGHELADEVNKLLFETELTLMTEAVVNKGKIKPYEQIGEADKYWPKRTPENSRIDPYQTIAEQFDLIRIADYQRYPCFFDYLGKRYLLKLEKVKDKND
jgi:methionyl-tRNA formyltransferase